VKLIKLEPKKEANLEVVAALKQLLKDAEAGEIIDLAYAGYTPSGQLISSFTQSEDRPRQLAAITRLQHRLIVSMD